MNNKYRSSSLLVASSQDYCNREKCYNSNSKAKIEIWKVEGTQGVPLISRRGICKFEIDSFVTKKDNLLIFLLRHILRRVRRHQSQSIVDMCHCLFRL